MADEQTLRDEMYDRIKGFFENSDLEILNVSDKYFAELSQIAYDLKEQVFDVVGIPDKLQDLPLKTWREQFHYNMIRREEDKR